MTTPRESRQRPARPVYLAEVATVEAELSAGRLYDGSSHAETACPVAVALVFTDGAAMLFTEAGDGRITRLRIPGDGFLHLTRDAPGKLARSRHPGSHPAPAGQGPVTPTAPHAPGPGHRDPSCPVTRQDVHDHMAVIAARHAANAYPGLLDGDTAGQLFALLTDTALAYQTEAEAGLAGPGPARPMAAACGLTATETLVAGLTENLADKAGDPAGLPVNGWLAWRTADDDPPAPDQGQTS